MPNREDGIQVLRRAAAALDEIATAPGELRLVDLGARLGLAKSTARRLLVGLVEVGYAAVDDGGRILLGDRLLGLGTADATHLAAQFRPALEAIAAATGETVDLSVLRGNQMWFIDQIESLRQTFDRELTREQKLAAAWRESTADLLNTQRCNAVLAQLLEAGSLNKSGYAQLCALSPATASKHLGTLAERGLLVQTGKGPATRYMLPA